MTMLAIEHEPVDKRWARITAHAPIFAATARDYLNQITVTARPRTVASVDIALRMFGSWIIDHDPDVIAMRQIERRHIEHYKLWLASRENYRGQPLKKSTISLRLSTLRVVIERLIEWDHPDTPPRNPIMWTDLPKIDEPLPKFLDDQDAAKFMAAAVRLDPQRRLVVEMLARTGLRVTEFCELTDDAIVKMNETNWLRVPVANSTPTATSPSTRSSSTFTAPGSTGTAQTTPADSSPTKANPSRSTSFAASSNAAPRSPGSATSTPTNSATPSLPSRSTTA